MILKNTTKKISIIIASIVAVPLVFLLILNIGLAYDSLYFPNQEKEFKESVDERNIEAEIRIYVDKEADKNLDIKLLISDSGKTKELERLVRENDVTYFCDAVAGGKYKVIVKNKTDSFVYSYVNVGDND